MDNLGDRVLQNSFSALDYFPIGVFFAFIHGDALSLLAIEDRVNAVNGTLVLSDGAIRRALPLLPGASR